jgi:hypothetical protein
MNIKKSLSMIMAGAIVIVSCNKDEKIVSPTISNEGLTTVQLQLINMADASDKPTGTWEQLIDANGNPLPVDVSQANLTLRANASYTASLVLLDKTQQPAFSVSDEVRARANYHLFFYQPLPTTAPLVIPNNYPNDLNDIYPEPIPTPIPAGGALNLTVTITDHDSNPQQYPLGLQTTFVAGASSNGWLRVLLRHQPNQKNGTFDPGSTDLDVGFNVKVQ